MNLEQELKKLYLNDLSEQLMVILTGPPLYLSFHSLQHGQWTKLLL